MAPSRTVDETFLALPLAALTDAALTRAVDLGCEHADIRVERIHTQTVSLRDARPEAFTDGEDLGDGRTRLTATSLVDSFADRDAFVASGMETGINEGYERLDEILARS